MVSPLISCEVKFDPDIVGRSNVILNVPIRKNVQSEYEYSFLAADLSEVILEIVVLAHKVC